MQWKQENLWRLTVRFTVVCPHVYVSHSCCSHNFRLTSATYSCIQLLVACYVCISRCRRLRFMVSTYLYIICFSECVRNFSFIEIKISPRQSTITVLLTNFHLSHSHHYVVSFASVKIKLKRASRWCENKLLTKCSPVKIRKILAVLLRWFAYMHACVHSTCARVYVKILRTGAVCFYELRWVSKKLRI